MNFEIFSVLVNPYIPRTTTLVLAKLLHMDHDLLIDLTSKLDTPERYLKYPVYSVHNGLISYKVMFYLLSVSDAIELLNGLEKLLQEQDIGQNSSEEFLAFRLACRHKVCDQAFFAKGWSTTAGRHEPSNVSKRV